MDAGVIQHCYIAPGEGHRHLERDEFYETEVNGIRLVDWVDALLGGEPLDDVHCQNCAACECGKNCRWSATGGASVSSGRRDVVPPYNQTNGEGSSYDFRPG
jgi:hypothetical protein